MDSTGNDALLKTTKVTEWNVNFGGYFALAFGGFLLLGCATAYVIAIARGNVDPFLPLISDAAGSPPQNGLFGTLICLGGMFGVVFMVQRYMIVLEKNREKSGLVTAINKLSLFAGIASMLGITLITGYPINFYRNRDVWLMDVGLPHMVGGVMLFALGLVYIALQCALTLFLKTKNQLTLVTRILLLFICTGAFVYHMITVPDNFGEISHLYYVNSTENELNHTGLLPYPPTMGASLKLPIDTSGSYIPSAITEWILVIFFCCFFFTFFNEAQQYSLLIVIETHAKHEPEISEETKADLRKMSLAHPQINSQVLTKPAPEVRKFLRRDSTCQTMTDDLDGVIIPKKDGSNGVAKPANPNPKPATKDISNESKNFLTNAEIDAKLNQLINNGQKEEGNGEVKSQETSTDIGVPANCEAVTIKRDGVKNSPEEDEDKEAERIAIEKIDDAVKDAEDSNTDAVKPSCAENGDKKTIKKSDSDEGLSSICPLSIQ